MMTSAAASASATNIGSGSRTNSNAYEEMKYSQHNSEVLKRSMTVIQEEDYEESALAVSHLGFNSNLGSSPNTTRLTRLGNSTLNRSGNLQNYSQTAKLNSGSLNQIQKDDHEANLKSAINLHQDQKMLSGQTQTFRAAHVNFSTADPYTDSQINSQSNLHGNEKKVQSVTSPNRRRPDESELSSSRLQNSSS